MCQCFSSIDYEKKWQNYIKIFSIDSEKFKMMKMSCIVCSKYRNFKNRKVYISKKVLGLFIVCSKCCNEYKNI